MRKRGVGAKNVGVAVPEGRVDVPVGRHSKRIDGVGVEVPLTTVGLSVAVNDGGGTGDEVRVEVEVGATLVGVAEGATLVSSSLPQAASAKQASRIGRKCRRMRRPLARPRFRPQSSK